MSKAIKITKNHEGGDWGGGGGEGDSKFRLFPTSNRSASNSLIEDHQRCNPHKIQQRYLLLDCCPKTDHFVRQL